MLPYDLFIANILIIYGIYNLFDEDMLLEKPGNWLRNKLGYVSKPLFDCTYCMASVHGTWFFLLFIDLGLIWWPLWCLMVSGAIFLINKI